MEAKNKKIIKDKKSILALAAAAVFVSFTFFVFAPFEMYLGNISEFWFNIGSFWFLSLGLFVAVFAMIFSVGLLLKGILREIYIALVFGSGLAIYVQSNFLNLNLGNLNGAKIVWHDYKADFIVNMIIWLVIIFVPAILAFIFRQKLLKPIAMIACLFTLMQVAALGVLLVTANWDESIGADGYVSSEGLMEAAEKHNAIVFVLDMYNGTFFEDILAKEPQLKEEFDGFTLYDNFTGAYSVTTYAVPYILTGSLMRNEASINAMADAAYDKAQYWRCLKDNNYKYNIFTQDAFIPRWMIQDIGNFETEKKHFTSYKDFSIFLFRFVASKYLPNGIKPYVWLNGTELEAITIGDGGAYYNESNRVFNELMQNEKMTIGDAENQFSFIHITGAHMPYYTDSNGNYSEEPTTVEQAARGALQLAINYLNELKRVGKYDDATIMITADHGHGKEGENVRQAPLMLMKPSGAKGAFSTSSAPVCQADIIPTIMTDCKLNEDYRFGKPFSQYKAGDERERYYYETIAADLPSVSTLREYIIDSKDNTTDNMKRTGKFYETNGDLTMEDIK